MKFNTIELTALYLLSALQKKNEKQAEKPKKLIIL